MELELDIFYYNDDGQRNLDLGLDDKEIPIEENSEFRKVTFYNISCISARTRKEGEKGDYCYIYSNADVFVTNKSYEEMKQLIKESTDQA